MDLVRIANACAVECVRQQVGLLEIGYLLNAYRNVVANGQIAFELPSDFIRVGILVEPEKNAGGFRHTPVTFRDGDSSANASDIPRLMNNLVLAMSQWNKGWDRETADVIVKEFLWIHPFADGNGRVGFLLYNWLRGTLDSPDPLPDYFGE